MPEQEFPSYKIADKQKWVERLNEQDRAIYEETRSLDIQKDVDAIMDIFEAFPELASVPKELLGYLALRFATPMRDCYEEGIQVGADQAEQRFQCERDEFHQREVMRLGGWG